MAVKIFCNGCQQFIRDAKPSEISSLKGTEVCRVCETRISKSIEDVEGIGKKAIHQINDVLSRAKAEMEEARRRVIDPERPKDGAQS